MVPNPSFEVHYDCSASWYYMPNVVGWTGMESPDYYNSCIIPTNNYNTDIPENLLGYQHPYEGNAYVGIATYNAYNFREYIEAKLIQKLNANSFYCTSFRISLADTSLWAVNKFGTYFSADTLSPPPFQSIPTPPFSIFTYYIPQVESTTFITDTSSWVSIDGIFQAIGNEEYITIGNFRDDNDTDTLRIQNSNLIYSYYYLDNISVEEVLNANAGNDSYFVPGDSIQLGNNPTENATYSWFPTIGLSDSNAPNPKAAPSATTTYIVTKTQCSVVTSDTVTLTLSGVGINEGENNMDVRLFPNPNDGNMTLRYNFSTDQSGTLKIYDLIGKLVGVFNLPNGDKILNITTENLKAGIYQFEILIDGQRRYTDKLVIVK